MAAGRPTMDDVAARAGVSRALVSLALNDSPRVSPASRAAIMTAAAELGYRTNLAARNLAAHRTDTLGVLLNDLHNPFFAEVFDGIAEAAGAADHRVLLTTARDRRAGEREAIDTMLAHRVDGMVLVGVRLPSSVIAGYAASVPTVVVGRVLRDDTVDCVANDDRRGAALAAAHLWDLGHRHIVHIDGGGGAGAAARRSGFVTALRRLGVDAPLVIDGDYTEQAGAEGARRVLRMRRRPTALFAANDLAALGALAVLDDAGVRVPEHVSVVGYDNSALARVAHVGLTSVDQSTVRMGQVASDLLLGRIAGRTTATTELVTPTLVVRATSGRVA